MKKILCILLSLILICAQLTGFADYTDYGDYRYEDNDDDSITITGYFGSATDLIIPDTINGKPVTGIGERVFFAKENLESVTIPANITIINMSAFRTNKLKIFIMLVKMVFYLIRIKLL